MGHKIDPATEGHLRLYHLTCSDPVNCGEDCPADFDEYPASKRAFVFSLARMRNNGIMNSPNPFEQYVVVDDRGETLDLTEKGYARPATEFH